MIIIISNNISGKILNADISGVGKGWGWRGDLESAPGAMDTHAIVTFGKDVM